MGTRWPGRIRTSRGSWRFARELTRFLTWAVALACAFEVRRSRDHAHGQVHGGGGQSRDAAAWAPGIAE
eukprot:1583187-Pyramimonas_sp.AAC.1